MHEAQLSFNERQVFRSGEDPMDRRADAACRKVQMREVSRARQCLTGAALAVGE